MSTNLSRGVTDRWRAWPRGAVVAGVVVGIAALLGYALAEYHGVRWYPSLDDALTELRVRSVGTVHPPLVGLPGRIFANDHLGSHPGPMSFFGLWPIYRLFGETAFGLRVATAGLHLVAIATALVLVGRRRASNASVVGFGVGIVALLMFLGPLAITKPWNPYLPVLWWVAFLVATWSGLDEDPLGPPIMAVAGSFCLQTHISYVGLVPGVAAVAVIGLIVRFRKARTWPARGVRRSWAIAAVLAIGLWIPPLVQQFTRTPGNFGILVSYFSNPPEAMIGLSRGASLVLAHLDPWSVWDQRFGVGFGSTIPGLILLAAWLASAVVAYRHQNWSVVRLDAVLAAGFGFGVVSAARIFGVVFFYLDLWSWGLLVLLVAATVWGTLDALPIRAVRPAVVGVGIGCLVLAAVFGARFVDDADAAAISDLDSRTVAALARQTGPALRRIDPHANGRYVLDWEDPLRLGSAGYGLLNELRRQHLPVGASPGYRQFVPAQYLMASGRATGRIHLAFGVAADRWRRTSGARVLASYDRRTRFQRALFAGYRTRALAALRAAGLERFAAELDDNTFAAQTDTRLPPAVRDAAVKMSALGENAVVVLVPPGDPSDPGRATTP